MSVPEAAESERLSQPVIRTPDQRLRVFVSSTLRELAEEREAARRAIASLHLIPVLFKLSVRPHPPRKLYRAYLSQSHVFVGIYWQRYGWMAPGMEVSGLDEFSELTANDLAVLLSERFEQARLRPEMLAVPSPRKPRFPTCARVTFLPARESRAGAGRRRSMDHWVGGQQPGRTGSVQRRTRTGRAFLPGEQGDLSRTRVRG